VAFEEPAYRKAENDENDSDFQKGKSLCIPRRAEFSVPACVSDQLLLRVRRGVLDAAQLTSDNWTRSTTLRNNPTEVCQRTLISSDAAPITAVVYS